MNESTAPDTREEHRSTLKHFLESATAIDTARWSLPRAEGKWSPGQITEHLIATYDVLLKEMNGGGGMAIRTRWWQRVVLRLKVFPDIMRFGRFPTGARAPREVRPPENPQPKDVLLERLKLRGDEFEKRLESFASDPAARITHAYFGRVKASDAFRFCSVHIAHHEKQLTS